LESKTQEDYFDDYLDNYNELLKKNELWRLRLQPQEFIDEVDRIFKKCAQDSLSGYLNAYASSANKKSMIAVLLMNKQTYEEILILQVENNAKIKSV
jgi:16S rRNA C967 or C1407 C5-methylase (RsmB/RsmF family)